MKRLKSLVIISLSFLVLMVGCNVLPSNNKDSKGLAKNIKSESQLNELLSRQLNLYRSNGWNWNFTATSGAKDNTEVLAPETSQTNVQVQGIDEGDTVKVDQGYIYKIQTNGLVILKVEDNGELSIKSKYELQDYTPIELYVEGDKLVMIGGTYSKPFTGFNAAKAGIYLDYMNYHTSVDIRVFDISNRGNISEEQHYTISGNYITSRRIDNTLYLISNEYSYIKAGVPTTPKVDGSTSLPVSSVETNTPSSPLPIITINDGEEKPLDLDDVYYYEDCIGNNFFTIMKIDIKNETKMFLKSYLCNYAGNIFVSHNYIYNALYSYTFSSMPLLNIYDYKVFTNVQRYSLQTLVNDINFKVEGNIKDRYSMDEYNTYFRIATTNYNIAKSSSGVYIFDKEGNEVGRIDKLAEGESIYSARFDKETAYIVTFKQIDPLFIIDLSDVTKPTVKSETKKEGVSLYLHRFENQPKMLGIGYNTNQGRIIGIEVVLFDVNDTENPLILDTYTTSDYSFYAEVLYNPRALLFMESKNLIGFASEEYQYSYLDGYYRYNNRQGYYVFRIIDNKFTVKFLTNVDELTNQNEYDYNAYLERYKKYITRSVVIGDYLYTISDQLIGIYDANTLEGKLKYNLG